MGKIYGNSLSLILSFAMFQLLHTNSNRRAYPMVIEDDYVAHGLRDVSTMTKDIEYFPSVWQCYNSSNIKVEYSGQYEISTIKSLYDRIKSLLKSNTKFNELNDKT